MSKISELSDGGVIQGGDTLIAVRSGGNVKVTYGGTTTANIDGGTIDGTTIGGSTPAAGSFTSLTSTGIDVTGTATVDGLISTNVSGTTLIQAVGADTDGFADVEIKSTGTSGASRLYFSDTTAQSGLIRYGHSTNSMEFYTNATERMRIDSSGNVGIGESSPFDKLVVRSSDANSVQSALSLKNGDIGTTAGVALNFVVDDNNNVITSAIYGQRTASAYHQGSLQFLTRDSGGAGLTERMRIDSSGNVGISTGHLRVALGSDEGSQLNLWSESSGEANVAAYTLKFKTGGNNSRTEAMRLDASGNLLVGTTTYNSDNQGVLLGATGVLYSTSTSGIAASLNRKTTDGEILRFQKDTTTVGSIGVQSSELFLGSSTGTGDAFIRMGYQTIVPALSTGLNNDGNINLGSGSARFKDLHLSGNINASTIISSGGRNSLGLQAESAGIGRIEQTSQITVADDATLTLTDTECGAVIIHVYDNSTGRGGIYFATYSGGTTLLAAEPSTNFSTSDVDGNFCVFKSGNSHTVTFKNRRGTSLPMTFMIVGAQAAKS